MKIPSKLQSERPLSSRGGRNFYIVVWYVVAGTVWLVGSDWLLGNFLHNQALRASADVIGDVLFVMSTAVLLSWLLKRYRRETQAAAAQVEAAAEELRVLSDNLPDSYTYRCVVKPDGQRQFAYVSAGVERLHGVKVEDVLRDPGTLLALVAPEARAALAAEEDACVKQLSDFQIELWMKGPGGEPCLIHLRSRPRRGLDGLIEWHGVATDITPRKHAELALQKNEQLLKVMERSAKTGGWDLNPVTGEGNWTEEVARIHDLDPGIKPNKEMGLKFFLAESRGRIEAAVKAAVERGMPYDLELELLSAKGAHKWVRTICQPVMEQGKVIKLHGSFQDITDTKIAAENLRHSAQNFREIFDATNEGIVLHDAETGQVLEVNDAMLHLSGYDTKAEFIQGRLEKVMVPDSAHDWNEALRRIHLTVTEGPQVLEWQNSKRNGDFVWVEVSLSSSKIGGEGRVLAVVRDISQRKAQELEIQRLTRLYATLSQVSQAIVHCQSRAALFAEFCRVMIEYGEFRWVWIGQRDGDTGRVETLAQRAAGDNPGATMPDCVMDCGLVAEAVTDGWPGICNNLATDPRAHACRAEAAALGLQACAAFPLHFQGGLFGAFALCTGEADFFKAEERRLLEEIAVDISYALDRLQEQERRKQAEAALRQSEEQFRAMFETAAIGMVQTDPLARQFLRVNRKFCEITGYAEAELLGMKVMDVTHPDDRETEQDLFRRVISGEAPNYRLENRYVRKDGMIAWVNVNMSPVRDVSGLPLRTMTTVEDITERKAAEETLRLQGAALSAAANAILITDRAGHIEWMNEAFTTISGYTAGDALRKNPRFLKSGEHDTAFYQNLWSTILAGKIWHGEMVNRRKDGSIYNEDMTITPLRDAQGRVAHFIAIKQDITERKRLEAQFRQSQKMEAIGTLAGGVAHDFNNILTSILMQVELATMGGELAPELHEGLQQIRDDADRAAALTRQLLLFSRRQVMQSRALDLNDLVTNLTKMLKRIIGEDVRLQLNLGAKRLMVHADPGMMDQVIMNLSVNARDAMPEGGQLRLDTREEVVDEAAAAAQLGARPGRFVVLSVSDTGTGIPPEVVPRIFEPFFTTKEAGKGTGLGLATVFGIVNQHHGWLTVDTSPGRGTTFKVYLPACIAPDPALGAAAAKAMPRGDNETILLVEDELVLRKTMRILLERHGYKVLEAENGEEGLKMWAAHRDLIALLLTDMVMPGQTNGLQLARQLQAERPGLKVIFATGYSAEIAGKEIELRLGENFMQKPVAPEMLLKVVRDSLDHSAE